MPYPKHRNIFRIESGKTRGWQVRIERRKRQYSKLFSDVLLGGTDEALEAALKWRDTMYEQLPSMAEVTEETRRKTAEAVNRTGVVGIGFSMQRQRNGRRVPYVAAYWRDPETGKRRATSYSVDKHGLRGAVRRACRSLREGRGEDPTRGQVDYLTRKALPGVKRLYAEAMAAENKKKKKPAARKKKRSKKA